MRLQNNLDFVEEMAGGAQGRVRKFRGRGLYVHMHYVLKEMVMPSLLHENSGS